MNPLGQRLLDRWDSGEDHAGVTSVMLDSAVDRGWVSVEQRDERVMVAPTLGTPVN